MTAQRPSGFRFEYDPPLIQYGHGCVDSLETELAAAGLERALVVCGETVGSTDAVIDPVTEGLGDRLVGVFPETTPEKRLDTAYRAAERMHEVGADALVSLGGGSSLDTAKVASLIAATGRSRAALGSTFEETGTIEVPDTSLPPVVVVPTTLAGADISQAAGITASPDSGLVSEERGGGVSHPKLMPHAVFADPALVATTPREILAASAMNGFNKGVETLYAANATVFTDGTAVRGLDELSDGLLAFGDGDESEETYAKLVRGLLGVQYGVSRPDGTTLSLIHSFGHALSRTAPLQQGTAHAVITPHALRYLFEQVDGRRDLLARALGVGDTEDPAAAVVDRVVEIRDALGLPSRLRDVDGPDRESVDEVAAAVVEDPFMRHALPGLDATPEEIEAVLEAAW
jgi:alcohol dehydrogenase class IV